MEQNQKQLQPFRISFELYAYDEQEAEEARMAIVTFIGQHAKQGRAVTGRKVTQAINNWDKNPLVKSQIINYFK